MSIIKLAIISDLHCAHSSKTTSINETNLLSDALRLPYQEHPMESFVEILAEMNLQADYLVCPGDITNRIDKQGLITGYGFLNEMKKELNAKELFLSLGNHDIDSYRNYEEYDSAYHVTRHFTKIFPYSGDNEAQTNDLNECFWSNGYYIFTNDEILVLNINTCFEHLNNKDVKSIKILRNTLNKIKKDLRKITFAGLKIAVLHHHPIKFSNSNIRYKDFDVIDNGDALLNLLSSESFDLVIHGHKHIPVIQERNGLHIFCSGSFSSTLNIKEVSGFNTFHIIEIDTNHPGAVGKIKTFYYSSQKGWFVFTDPYYFFPHQTGFGNRQDLGIIVNDIKRMVGNNNYIKFQDITTSIPNIVYLKPQEQERLEQLLEAEKLTFTPRLPLEPKYLDNYGNR